MEKGDGAQLRDDGEIVSTDTEKLCLDSVRWSVRMVIPGLSRAL